MSVRRLTTILILLLASPAWPQTPAPAQSPAPTPPTTEKPYANMPKQAVPFQRFRKPYKEWYLDPDTLEYTGGARSEPDGDLSRLPAVNIGFLGPLDKDNYDSVYGIAMLHGAQLAIEEANVRVGADGKPGDQGKPFALKVHDDLPLWGASAMEIVKMRFDEHDWAMLGSIDAASTHIAIRTTLKIELPIVNTATTDPTETETRVPWLLHDFPDDRQQGYALADYIFNQLKLKNIGVLRSTDRYGRKGDEIFFAEARRIGRQPLLEAKFDPTETDFTGQLLMLRNVGIDGLVIWGNAPQAAMILKQMRGMGMTQPVFGSGRIAYPEVLKIAGPAAEGLVTVCPLDPARSDPAWQEFRQHFLKRFGKEPDAYASYAYDGMNILIDAIKKAGLNRGRIMDALREYGAKNYQGVSGQARFDYTLNNIAPVWFAQVKNGKFIYWPEYRTDWSAQSPASAR